MKKNKCRKVETEDEHSSMYYWCYPIISIVFMIMIVIGLYFIVGYNSCF